MDEQRFDNLTRLAASLHSRRALLKLLFSSAFASLLPVQRSLALQPTCEGIPDGDPCVGGEGCFRCKNGRCRPDHDVCEIECQCSRGCNTQTFMCECGCTGGKQCCDGGCVDINTSNEHCGECHKR